MSPSWFGGLPSNSRSLRVSVASSKRLLLGSLGVEWVRVLPGFRAYEGWGLGFNTSALRPPETLDLLTEP